MWGDAMLEEFKFIDSGRESFEFALGCLWAATKERVKPMNIVVKIGRWSVGGVTAAYGIFHLCGFAHAISMALGKTGSFYNTLVAHQHLEAAESYRAASPMLALYLLAMGLSNLTAAICLVRWRPRTFTFACLGVFVTSMMFTAASLWDNWDTLVGWRLADRGWQFIPLGLLVGAAYVFWLLGSRNKSQGIAA